MKTYLVTGGAGFIGSHLVDALVKRGHRVLVVDNLSGGRKENLNPKARFYKADICEFKTIKPLFAGVDVVFHLAAIPRVPVSMKDPVGTSRVNILGTINVFKAAAEAKVKKVIFASSSSVYGNQKTSPLQESMVPGPLSPYALQKLVGEQTAKLFTAIYRVPIISLRYFNVYGPRIDFDSDYSLVMGKFLKLKSLKKPLTIFGDGKQTRGFCYIDDVVSANMKAAQSGKVQGGDIINVGSAKSYSVNFLAQLMGGKVLHLPKRAGDVLHTKADISKAKKLLGWQPRVPLEEGLKKVQAWFDSIK